jgi:hypothetical protein
VSRKYKGEARASILSFMYDYILISGFYLESPYLGGFEGFDLTNPRGRFSGERFHLACPKLGLGDAILSHTILVLIYSVKRVLHQPHAQEEKEGAPLGVSSKGGAPSIKGSSFQVIGRASGYSSTWVFIAGSWPLDLVHPGGVLCAI